MGSPCSVKMKGSRVSAARVISNITLQARAGQEERTCLQASDSRDEDGIPVEYRSLPEYKELLELKKLKKHKIHEIHAENTLTQHMGYKVSSALTPPKCDGCGTEPIQGVRWHCRDCPQDIAIDFCSNCSDCMFKTETHMPSHQLEPVYQAETFLDRDYCLPHSAGYNYLDPNYFPANR
ncbi:hypothetical protein JZ751_009169 [Albula glossodonta]|uniref:ZZ-type domain-containing protein n=1 Tax=Albula glossodonta TaxID=121402 RepID=A0A8T2NC78_9TELE|nr:hypothetical protein JZ751_009169 [Albula glossodonta]